MNTIVAEIFRHLALPFDMQAREAIARWEHDNPPFKHGEFGYSLAQYGLSAAEVKARFAEYSSRFIAR